MPLKIRSLFIFILLQVCLNFTGYAQSNDCINLDDSGFNKQAFTIFEKDLFNHYQTETDRVKKYRKFLMEIASLSVDLRKLPSTEAVETARSFKEKALGKNSIWVKLSDYQNQEASQKPTPYTTPAKGNEQEIYTFNYRGGFIQCLKNTNVSEDFKDIVTLLENDANISTSLVAQRIYYMTDAEIDSEEVRQFIAFDIYYSILMVIEKAFG